MKRAVNKVIYQIFVENRRLLLLDFCVLCFICGTEVKTANFYDFGVLGYLLMVFTNHYYILYCLLPVMIIILTRQLRRIRNVELIRYKNYLEQIRAHTGKITLWIICLFLLKIVTVIGIGIVGIGNIAPLENVNISGYDEMLFIYNAYVDYFNNPIVAVGAAASYCVLGFILLSAILLRTNMLLGEKKTVFLSVIIYVLAMVGFKTELKTKMPLLCFNNYIILHHGLLVNGEFVFVFLILATVFTITLCLICGGEYSKKNSLLLNSFAITKRNYFSTAIFLLVAIFIEIMRGYPIPEFSLRDGVLMYLIGSDVGTQSFISWLKVAITYLFPLFIAGVSWQKIHQYGYTPLIVRFKNLSCFEYSISQNNIKYLCCYAVFLWGLGCITYFAGGESDINQRYICDLYGNKYDLQVWNIFILYFVINLLFDYILMESISKKINTVIAFLIVMLSHFAAYLVPMRDFFITNISLGYAMRTLYDDLPVDYGLWIMIIVILFYFVILMRRRLGNGNYKS